MANEEDPDWRDKLPPEIRSNSTGANTNHYGSAVGYDWEDFLGDPDQDFAGMTREDSGNTQSLFDEARPWTQVAQVQRPPTEEPELYDDDFEDPPEAGTPVPEEEIADIPRVRNHGRQRANADAQLVVEIKTRLQNLYPGLRLNSMSQSPGIRPRRKADSCRRRVNVLRANFGRGWPGLPKDTHLRHRIDRWQGARLPPSEGIPREVCSRDRSLPLLRHPGLRATGRKGRHHDRLQNARRQSALRHHHEALPHWSGSPCPRAWLRP